LRSGRGRTTDVREPEEIPGSVAAEAGAVLATVAQNLRLRVDAPGGGRLERVYGTIVEERVEETEELSLGDLAAGVRAVLAGDSAILHTAIPQQSTPRGSARALSSSSSTTRRR
jgi:hypothetical protein